MFGSNFVRHVTPYLSNFLYLSYSVCHIFSIFFSSPALQHQGEFESAVGQRQICVANIMVAVSTMEIKLTPYYFKSV